MPRGVDPAPTTSIDSTLASKRGVSSAVPAAIVFGPGPYGRGISIAPSEPGGSLPR
jgi:hypothetical protein